MCAIKLLYNNRCDNCVYKRNLSMRSILLVLMILVNQIGFAQRITPSPYVKPDDSVLTASINHSIDDFSINVIMKRLYGDKDWKQTTFPLVRLNHNCDTLQLNPYYEVVKIIKVGINYYRIDGETIKYIGSDHVKYTKTKF